MPLGKLIPDLLASEREPTNFASLLEMVLSYMIAVAEARKKETVADADTDPPERDDDGAWVRGASDRDGGSVDGGERGDNYMDPSAFVKSLCRALRKGCHGAPACDWGPVILPIVALLPTYVPTIARSHGDGEEGKGRTEDESKETVREERPFSISVVSSLVSLI